MLRDGGSCKLAASRGPGVLNGGAAMAPQLCDRVRQRALDAHAGQQQRVWRPLGRLRVGAGGVEAEEQNEACAGCVEGWLQVADGV